MSSEIGARSAVDKSLPCQDGDDISLLAGADFQHQQAFFGENQRDLGCEAAIGVEPVGAAIQCPDRIVIADGRGETRHFPLRNIGRVREDQVEFRRERRGPIRDHEAAPVG